MITFWPSIQFDKPVTVILVDKDQIKSKKFSFTNKVLKDQIAALAQSDQFSGEDGQIFPLLLSNMIALLVGIGDPKELSLTALRVTVR
ncbi:MAG: hypothetical protein KAR31_12150, partial [Candidatus Omnitrophica bacterium]|nr:hypothetical protein [Candidatus Omnitrophota bacterium]